MLAVPLHLGVVRERGYQRAAAVPSHGDDYYDPTEGNGGNASVPGLAEGLGWLVTGVMACAAVGMVQRSTETG